MVPVGAPAVNPVASYSEQMQSDSIELIDDHGFATWREEKLACYPFPSAGVMVDIADPAALTRPEIEALRANIRRYNFTGFRCARPDQVTPQTLLEFGKQFGLCRIDGNLCAESSGVSAIRVAGRDGAREYIPYTNRPLSWHTDGYYNSHEESVRAWLLYCDQPATEGGVNRLLDHELIYLQLHAANPNWTRALTRPDAFTIPPNVADGAQLRPARSSPVFSRDPASGQLHMRFSARKTNILWRDDPTTRAAREALLQLISDAVDHIYKYRLQRGEGFLSNNVLHDRNGFRNAHDGTPSRLLYRIRYLDRIAAT
jgi:hypothetical protein